MSFSSKAGRPTLRVVIPARYGSSRLPGKPLIDLAGKPMVVRVYEAVRRALVAADVVVATDDDRVLAALHHNDIPGVMTLAGHESGTDRAAEVARLRGWSDRDVVLNVQGDEPLIPRDLLQAFADFCDNDDIEMATVVTPVARRSDIHDLNVVKVVLGAGNNALYFSRSPIPFSRDCPEGLWPLDAYLKHVGLYAYRNATLQRLTTQSACMLEQVEKLEQLRALWMGISIKTMWWGGTPPHGVDTAEDVVRVSTLIRGME